MLRQPGFYEALDVIMSRASVAEKRAWEDHCDQVHGKAWREQFQTELLRVVAPAIDKKMQEPEHAFGKQLCAALVLILALFTLPLHAQKAESCRHCPTAAEMDQQFPEAPQAHKPLGKLFWTATAIHAGAISFDAYETISHEGVCGLEGHNGFPEFEAGKELAAEGAVEFGFVFLFDWLVQRSNPPKAFKWMPFGGPAYGTALHLRGGIQWYSRC